MISAFLASTSSLFWGGADFISGIGSRKIGALRVSVHMFMAAAVVSVITFFIVPSSFSTIAIVAGLIAAFTNAIGFVTFYAGLSLAPMGIVSAIVAASQAMIPIIIGSLVKQEHVSNIGWVGIILAAGGAILVGTAEGTDGKVKPAAIFLAIVSGITFAFAIVALDWAPEESGMTAPTIEMVVGMLFIAAFYIAAKKTFAIRKWAMTLDLYKTSEQLTTREIKTIKRRSYFSGTIQGLANVTLMFALWNGSLTVVGVIACLYPVVTVVLAWIFLGEKLKALHIIGISLALTGAVLLALV